MLYFPDSKDQGYCNNCHEIFLETECLPSPFCIYRIPSKITKLGWTSCYFFKDRRQEARPILLGQQYIGGCQTPIRITHMYYIPPNS